MSAQRWFGRWLDVDVSFGVRRWLLLHSLSFQFMRRDRATANDDVGAAQAIPDPVVNTNDCADGRVAHAANPAERGAVQPVGTRLPMVTGRGAATGRVLAEAALQIARAPTSDAATVAW